MHLHLLQIFLTDFLDDIPLYWRHNMFSLQDEVPLHFALTVCMFLNRKFHRTMRPLRSQDLTPLDFFLWDHVKSVAYKNNERSIQELKVYITLKSPNLQKISLIGFRVRASRVGRCLHVDGGHLKIHYDLVMFQYYNTFIPMVCHLWPILYYERNRLQWQKPSKLSKNLLPEWRQYMTLFKLHMQRNTFC